MTAHGPTLLIIDDNSMNRRLVETIFTNEGFRVLKAVDGPGGRALARAESPDIILLDVIMPGENGFDTCEALKRDPDTSGIPVVFLSASVDVRAQERGLASGALDYITKPYDRAELVARTRRLLKEK